MEWKNSVVQPSLNKRKSGSKQKENVFFKSPKLCLRCSATLYLVFLVWNYLFRNKFGPFLLHLSLLSFLPVSFVWSTFIVVIVMPLPLVPFFFYCISISMLVDFWPYSSCCRQTTRKNAIEMVSTELSKFHKNKTKNTPKSNSTLNIIYHSAHTERDRERDRESNNNSNKKASSSNKNKKRNTCYSDRAKNMG